MPGFVAANSLVMMACYVAAIVHDFEHPGVLGKLVHDA